VALWRDDREAAARAVRHSMLIGNHELAPDIPE
jgi:hypothetical protein